MSFLKETWIVALYETRAMLLSVRALLMVVSYGVISGGIGAAFLWLDRQAGGQLQSVTQKASELPPEQREEIVHQLSEKLGQPLAQAIVSGDLPPLVLAVLALSTFAIPGLVLLVGYGGLAEDLSSRFARYVLQRVRRGSYLAGKMAGHFVVTYAAVIVVHALLLAYASTISNFELDKTLPVLPRIWAAMALFIMGYVAFTACFSATISPPFAAFVLGAVALFGLWIVSFIPNVGEVWMGKWHMQLWAFDPMAAGVYAANALVLSALAYLGLRRRDV
jgi:hypothetical protein